MSGGDTVRDFDLDTTDLDPRDPAAGQRPAIALAADDTLDGYTRADLRREELEIARRFENGPLWFYPAWAVTALVVWIALFPLTMSGHLNLFVACMIASFIAAGGFVTGHEAYHDNMVRAGGKHRWLNDFTGTISCIPILLPYSVGKLTHIRHHRFVNHPDHDPDYQDWGHNFWHAAWRSWLGRQPRGQGSLAAYRRTLQDMDTPAARKALREGAIFQMVYLGTLFTMAWSGYALEAAMVWWIPRHIGLWFIRLSLSWAPHHPRKDQSRYGNARIMKSPVGNFLAMGMEVHMVHHLYPKIPHHRTKPAYWALKPVLEKRGVDCSAL